jgi:hypothetical protein
VRYVAWSPDFLGSHIPSTYNMYLYKENVYMAFMNPSCCQAQPVCSVNVTSRRQDEVVHSVLESFLLMAF